MKKFKYAKTEHALRNIHRRWASFARYWLQTIEEESGIKQTIKNNWLLQEIKEITDIIEGKRTITRVLQCGNCKFPVDAIGKVKIVQDSQIERIFICPECKKIIKIDYITQPTFRALKY